MKNQVEMSSEIYQLDDLINDVYDKVYAEIGDFNIDYFNITNLNLERFKLYDYNLDTIFTKTKIKYSGNYNTGLNNIHESSKTIEEIHFKRQGETHMTTIRIVPYIDRDNINNISDPINVHQIIKTLLSELVVSGKTNRILLPIINVDIEGDYLKDYNAISSYIDPKKIYSIEITEKFFSLTTLENFLKEYPLNSDIFEYIIYQIVDVLYEINLVYPGFKYNQLIPQHIDCYLKNKNDIIFPELKLCDFYLSEIKDIVENSYLKNIEIREIDNPYADLYQFLNYLWKNYYIDISKYPHIIDIFNNILPQKIRSSDFYLTKDLWNTLSDEEKIELEIKNIRNNDFFINKYPMNSKFIEANMNRIKNNKKSNDNHIVMSNKKKNINNEKSISDINETTLDNDNEKLNDKFYTVSSNSTKKQSEKIKLTAGKKNSKNNKEFTYHGRRIINNNIGNNIINNKNNNDLLNQFQNNDLYGSQQQKMSAIGSLLGASQNDLSRTPAASYGQIMQQLAQQYPNHVNQTFLPGQFPQNQISSMPAQQENMLQDNEALMKYLNASNIDPNMMNNYMNMMQQPQQVYQPQIPQQMYQMPPMQQPSMMPQQMQIPQTSMAAQQMPLQNGGSVGTKKNPFFFQ